MMTVNSWAKRIVCSTVHKKRDTLQSKGMTHCTANISSASPLPIWT